MRRPNPPDQVAGAYVFHRDREALELLKEGEFRSEAGYLGLEQAPAGMDERRRWNSTKT